MNAQVYGSVVAMEFKGRPKVSFEDFVEDFDLAFQMVDSETRTLTWESADVAIIDRDYVRVAIGWLPSAGKRQPWHLVIVVGSSPDEDMAKIEPASYDFLADRVGKRPSRSRWSLLTRALTCWALRRVNKHMMWRGLNLQTGRPATRMKKPMRTWSKPCFRLGRSVLRLALRWFRMPRTVIQSLSSTKRKKRRWIRP